MRVMLVVTALTFVLATFAGCTGRFDIEQTEPIRIQIDGDGEEARLAAADDDPTTVESREYIVETVDVETVVVVVEVRNAAPQDDGFGDDVETTQTTTTTTQETGDGNDTTTTVATTTTTRDGGQGSGRTAIVLVIVEDRDTGERLAEERVEAGNEPATAELNVRVAGKDNVVVITQAVEGMADVNVSARGEGNDGGGGGGGETTMATTATTETRMTTTATTATMSPSPTNETTSPSPTNDTNGG